MQMKNSTITRKRLLAVFSWIVVLCGFLLVLLLIKLIIRDIWIMLLSVISPSSPIVTFVIKWISLIMIIGGIVLVICLLFSRTRHGSRWFQWFVQINEATFWRVKNNKSDDNRK
jgi:hypothetical protein